VVSRASAALQGLRPESVVLMGKNTMMKRSIREHSKRTGNTEWLVRRARRAQRARF
jgi:hypothetical protein